MASLKDLKNRIKSVKSTQKITKAMKMVAAAKLRRAIEHAQAARPYACSLEAMLQNLAASAAASPDAPRLLIGTGKRHKHLLIVATGDRGLCGAFNGSIARAARKQVRELQSQGKEVKLLFVGRKGYELLKGEFSSLQFGKLRELGRGRVSYDDAQAIATAVLDAIETQGFDVVQIIYNHFKSAISQQVTFQQLMPLPLNSNAPATGASAVYEYEPSETEILNDLLPRNVGVQIYRALLENSASFYGSQMTAMDNATRNAGDMIKKLTLVYNRTRQAAITKELIEIISGAQAV
jgi:F-type H+-transporting ATPase subunit gamma